MTSPADAWLGVAVMVLASVGCSDSGTPSTASTSSSASDASSSSSTSGAGAGGAGGSSACPQCAAPVEAGTVANPAIVEASGIVASQSHPGAFYVHNDSGDSARFFAVDDKGADLGSYEVEGATAVDWEDIARGPCADPSKSCVFLADMGDNAVARTDYVIYRVEEPATLAAGAHVVSGDALHFVYPDGSHNAEALLFDPKIGALVIITKNANESGIYAFAPPFDTGKTATVARLGTAQVPDILPLVTSADLSPDRSALLVRTYGSVWRYEVGADVAIETALTTTPCLLTTPTEPQGEAVAWRTDGSGFVTVSEGVKPPLFSVSCK